MECSKSTKLPQALADQQMTKSLPENGNGALSESFKKLNGTLTKKGRYFGQSLSDGNNLLDGNMDILIRDFGNAIFGEVLKEILEGCNYSVLLMVNILSSASLIYVTPPCSYRDRSSNFSSILSTSKASQEFIIRDLAHSMLVRSSREA
jgi:hypothetical protein